MEDYVQNTPIFDQNFAPLRALLDGDISELVINRPKEVWTEGPTGWLKHDIPTLTMERLMFIATNIASFKGAGIDKDSPFLSAALPTGERSEIVIPPALVKGTFSLTVRKPSVKQSTIDKLDEQGVFSNAALANKDILPFEKELLLFLKNGQIKEFFKLAILNHRNIVLCGKTGSGKTHIAKAFADYIPLSERIITIEDVHEFFLAHQNRVNMIFTRDGKVHVKDCLASCLRMKPDRILLSEMRGDESWEFLKSIGSAHPGAITTMHASSSSEAFDQLISLIKDSQVGAHLDLSYLQRRLYATVDIVVACANRKITEIYYDPEIKRSNMA
ncbi:MAG: P-type DNA transfer ATPase VirB11 [Candidatus Saccharibacteria bacterium]|nr:P-type DNA transfer ATPase VirB11 [Candidatus Saccharibacteria bacterium]